MNGKLSEQIENFKQSYGIYLAATCVMLIVTKGFDYISSFYYLLVPILLGIILTELISNRKLPKRWPVTIYFLPFITWILLSAIWSIHPEVTLTRSIYFLILVAGMESLSNFYQKGVGSLMKIFLPVIALVVSSSIFSLAIGIPADSWSGGNAKGFMGFSSHQNTLGSILLFILPIMNYKLFTNYLPMYKKIMKSENSLSLARKLLHPKFIFWVLLNLGSIFLLVITFSRASILSYLIFLSITIIGLFGFRNYLVSVLTFILLIVITYQIPGIDNFYKYIIYKGDNKIYDTRTILFDASIEASKRGGLFGLGYGISDQKIIIHNTGRVKDGIYIREKGNSTLALIEETGLIGMLLFSIPILLVLKNNLYRLKVLKREKNREGYIYLLFIFSILISLLFHAQFEAWFVGIGSLQLPLFFLLFFESNILNQKHNT